MGSARALDRILDMGHEKVALADRIDWRFLSEKMGDVYTDGPVSPMFFPPTTQI